MIFLLLGERHQGDREDNLDRHGHFSAGSWSFSYMLDGFKPAEPHFVSGLHAAIHRRAQQLPTKVSYDALRQVLHDAVAEAGAKEGGTSAAFYVEAEGEAGCFTAGDTRIYWLNREERTRDHSRAQDFIDRGKSPPESLNDHPYRNYLTRSLSGRCGMTQLVERRCTPLTQGELLLLCTDGFWRHLDERRLFACVSPALVTAAINDVLHQAIGERDNCSVMLLCRGWQRQRHD